MRNEARWDRWNLHTHSSVAMDQWKQTTNRALAIFYMRAYRDSRVHLQIFYLGLGNWHFFGLVTRSRVISFVPCFPLRQVMKLKSNSSAHYLSQMGVKSKAIGIVRISLWVCVVIVVKEKGATKNYNGKLMRSSSFRWLFLLDALWLWCSYCCFGLGKICYKIEHLFSFIYKKRNASSFCLFTNE